MIVNDLCVAKEKGIDRVTLHFPQPSSLNNSDAPVQILSASLALTAEQLQPFLQQMPISFTVDANPAPTGKSFFLGSAFHLIIVCTHMRMSESPSEFSFRLSCAPVFC